MLTRRLHIGCCGLPDAVLAEVVKPDKCSADFNALPVTLRQGQYQQKHSVLLYYCVEADMCKSRVNSGQGFLRACNLHINHMKIHLVSVGIPRGPACALVPLQVSGNITLRSFEINSRRIPAQRIAGLLAISPSARSMHVANWFTWQHNHIGACHLPGSTRHAVYMRISVSKFMTGPTLSTAAEMPTEPTKTSQTFLTLPRSEVMWCIARAETTNTPQLQH